MTPVAVDKLKKQGLKSFSATSASSMESGGFSGLYDAGNGIVILSLTYSQTATFDTNKTLWTIPSEYRPSEAKSVPAIVFNGSNVPAINVIRINTDGTVQQRATSSAIKVFASGSYQI